jgi:hypothetical protein
MRDHGYDKVWKSALNPEGRRKFKFARATIERYGADLDRIASDHEKKAKELRAAKTFYDDSIRQMDEFKKMMDGWGKPKELRP